MQRNDTFDPQDRPTFDFGIYLRTGRRVVIGGMGKDVEVKFNPWHDPDDGRFTFVGQGRYYGRGSGGQRRDAAAADRRAPATPAQGDRPGSVDPWQFDARNPRNHSIHIVRRGDTLTSIAARRRGVTVADLAWLNDTTIDRPIGVGQRIKLPNQDYLDAGRDARKRLLALSYYMDKHGGRLPPNPAKPPSLAEQLAEERHLHSANGYVAQVDGLLRTRDIGGKLVNVRSARSRRNQAQAGMPDRLRSDDGGHYIAARFNGPREPFNHFPQDSGINRGEYRVIEEGWAARLAEGKEVRVRIIQQYVGRSQRPYALQVLWYVDGKGYRKTISNTRKGR